MVKALELLDETQGRVWKPGNSERGGRDRIDWASAWRRRTLVPREPLLIISLHFSFSFLTFNKQNLRGGFPLLHWQRPKRVLADTRGSKWRYYANSDDFFFY